MSEWSLNAGARARIDVELQAIDIAHEAKGFPKCELCGQRCRKLDEFGLCSKVSESHREWRANPANRDVTA